MKAVAFSELLLLVAILAVAWFVYVQQEQLALLELEIDRLRGGLEPPLLPMAENSSQAAVVPKPKPKPKPRQPRPKP